MGVLRAGTAAVAVLGQPRQGLLLTHLSENPASVKHIIRPEHLPALLPQPLLSLRRPGARPACPFVSPHGTVEQLSELCGHRDTDPHLGALCRKGSAGLAPLRAGDTMSLARQGDRRPRDKHQPPVPSHGQVLLPTQSSPQPRRACR